MKNMEILGVEAEHKGNRHSSNSNKLLFKKVGKAARGRWSEILPALEIASTHLVNTHGPCPGCGGKDRFRFDDREGRGTFICGQGTGEPIAGDGFELLCHANKWSKSTALEKVNTLLESGELPEPVPRKPTAKPKSNSNIAKTVNRLLKLAKPAPTDHPYLESKGLSADGLNVNNNGWLLFPMTGVDGEITSCQQVSPDGAKRYINGSRPNGSYWLNKEEFDDGRLFVVEGPADALALGEIGFTAACAFGTNNLKAAARALETQFPDIKIILAPDNDKAGQKAAKNSSWPVIYPASQETDWADMFQKEEAKSIQEYVNNEYKKIPVKEKISYTSCISNTGKGTKGVGSVESVGLPLPTPGCLLVDTDHGLKRLIISKAVLLVAEAARGLFAFDEESKVWHVYTGSYWRAEINPTTIEREQVGWIYNATEPLGFTPQYQIDILKLLERGGFVDLPKFARGFVPFSNGLLNIATLKFSDPTPETAQTWAIPHSYDSDAYCPAILDWLNKATGGDEDTVQLLRAIIAAILRDPAEHQRFLHLLGPGGSGKSTFMRLLVELVGKQNAVSTELRQLEQNQFEGALLFRKRLVLITDTDRYGKSLNKLKAIVGGDPIRLERKNIQQAGTFTLDGLVVIASNEAIQSTDHTSGLERRRITVPFERVFTESEKADFHRKGGETQLLREIPGLVNWSLAMSEEEVRRAIAHPPERVRQANLEAMRDSNPLADWIMDELIPDSLTWLQIGKLETSLGINGISYLYADKKLYPNYHLWCKENGHHPLSVQRFRITIEDACRNVLKIPIRKARHSSGMGIEGLRFRKEDELPYEWGVKTPPNPTPITPKCRPIRSQVTDSVGSARSVDSDCNFISDSKDNVDSSESNPSLNINGGEK